MFGCWVLQKARLGSAALPAESLIAAGSFNRMGGAYHTFPAWNCHHTRRFMCVLTSKPWINPQGGSEEMEVWMSDPWTKSCKSGRKGPELESESTRNSVGFTQSNSSWVITQISYFTISLHTMAFVGEVNIPGLFRGHRIHCAQNSSFGQRESVMTALESSWREELRHSLMPPGPFSQPLPSFLPFSWKCLNLLSPQPASHMFIRFSLPLRMMVQGDARRSHEHPYMKLNATMTKMGQMVPVITCLSSCGMACLRPSDRTRNFQGARKVLVSFSVQCLSKYACLPGIATLFS